MEPVRKSPRSTKGKNSRLDQERILEEQLSKAQTLKNEEKDEDDGEVRCLVCGMTTADYIEDGREMIQCEKCDSWQHTACMFGRKKVPQKYYCNICDPTNPSFKNLKLKLSYEDYVGGAGQKDLEYQEDEPQKAKKLAESERPTKKAKIARESISKVEALESINTTRHSVAQNFYLTFLQKIPDDYTDLKNTTKEKLADDWGSQLEGYIYDHIGLKPGKKSLAQKTSPGAKYLEKARTLLFNLKNTKNDLSTRVLNREVSLEDLSQLSSEQMLNADYQRFADDVRKQSINQTVLKVNENLPRVKITHKGEEVIDNYEYEKEREREIEQQREQIKEQEEKDVTKQAKEAQESFFNANLLYPAATTATVEDYDTEQPEHTLNDDPELDKILNDEPNVPAQTHSDEYYPAQNTTTPQSDEEYDPTVGFRTESTQFNQVWTGDLTFPEFGAFRASAKLLGSTLSRVPTESENQKIISLFKQFGTQELVEIEGRLDSVKAEPYLSEIASTRDLYVLVFEPQSLASEFENEENSFSYQRLHQYFAKREKYGVVGARPVSVKDFYLVPIKAGGDLPKSFLQFGNYSEIREYEKEKERFFGVLVVKRGYNP
ncbi:unnamed protein product [Kuraishia capsulata CBS 1993]|uniref:Transcription factor BYE1 n=1 Tax=Kuraishia capsulata CBS 1993 TaxID=1382522 RepID=W6MIB6_9ASCO|nr:uncharacterized protein KUCA_T00000037001 [Kuraishia capsulata CBS 1993]CDK24077.1 unnamed protein product [Kuraishia capsulata CBS 1993]